MATSQQSSGTGGIADGLSDAARSATDNRVVDLGARAGYAVNGILHLLIAWLGVGVALGRHDAKADPSGAMAVIAGTPFGKIVLVAVVVAFALLALWQVGECVRGPGAADRAKAAAKAVVYLALASGAISFVAGSGSSGANQAGGATAALMDLPFGQALVVLAGVAVAGVGGYHIHKGWTEKFREDLAGAPSRLTVVAGKVGYIARGIAFIAIGIGVVTAGVTHHPSRSRGLDGALRDMVALPWGPAIVLLVAAGFAAFGLYSFSRARRART